MLPPPLLTIPEVAKILQISPAKAYSMAQARVLPTVQLGRNVRVRPADLEAYIESCVERGEGSVQ